MACLPVLSYKAITRHPHKAFVLRACLPTTRPVIHAMNYYPVLSLSRSFPPHPTHSHRRPSTPPLIPPSPLSQLDIVLAPPISKPPPQCHHAPNTQNPTPTQQSTHPPTTPPPQSHHPPTLLVALLPTTTPQPRKANRSITSSAANANAS